MTEGEEIQIGDYVAYNVSGNTEYGTVISIDSSGYTVRAESALDNTVVGLGPDSVTKVQRG